MTGLFNWLFAMVVGSTPMPVVWVDVADEMIELSCQGLACSDQLLVNSSETYQQILKNFTTQCPMPEPAPINLQARIFADIPTWLTVWYQKPRGLVYQSLIQRLGFNTITKACGEITQNQPKLSQVHIRLSQNSPNSGMATALYVDTPMVWPKKVPANLAWWMGASVNPQQMWALLLKLAFVWTPLPTTLFTAQMDAIEQQLKPINLWEALGAAKKTWNIFALATENQQLEWLATCEVENGAWVERLFIAMADLLPLVNPSVRVEIQKDKNAKVLVIQSAAQEDWLAIKVETNLVLLASSSKSFRLLQKTSSSSKMAMEPVGPLVGYIDGNKFWPWLNQNLTKRQREQWQWPQTLGQRLANQAGQTPLMGDVLNKMVWSIVPTTEIWNLYLQVQSNQFERKH